MANIDILNMSDEELMNFDPSKLETETPETTAPEEVAEEDPAPTPNPEVEVEQAPEVDEVPAESVTDENAEVSGEDEGKEKPEPAKTEQGEKPTKPVAEKPEGEKKPEGESQESNEVDYKAQLERILSPIKANGREIQVSSVDDAIQLMQMGANYHKKMASLKPNLGILKMLEQHNVLDQEKLSFLIDLSKGNPEAIKKLVKDSGLDPLDLDTKAGDYKQSSYAVDEKAVELDTVLDDLKGSTHFGNLMTVVGKQWDGASRQILADNPEVLRVLSAHMEQGIFDKITGKMETERALGRLTGLSDVEAYRTVGDRMQAAGEFNGLVHQTKATPKVAPVKSAPKPESSETNIKKLAASPTRAKAPVKQQPINVLNMSDEELMKLDITQFTTR